MRNALEEVMKRVSSAYSTPSIKTYLAQCILTTRPQTRCGEFGFRAGRYWLPAGGGSARIPGQMASARKHFSRAEFRGHPTRRRYRVSPRFQCRTRKGGTPRLKDGTPRAECR